MRREFIEKLLKMAADIDAEIHVIKCDGEPEPVDEDAEAKKEFAEIAKMNRLLYQAHLDAGFDECDAMGLTLAMISR